MKFTFPKERWDSISNEAKDLLSHMIAPESERYTADEVLTHPWFKIVKEKKLEKLNFSPIFLKEYKESNQLKKIVLSLIASRLKESDIKDLKEIFKAFDKNKDGQISFDEFEKGLLKLNSKDIKPEEIKSYFTSIDTDKNGKIDYTEFIAATLQKNIFLKEERLFDAFSMLDKDHNGKITKDELMNVLKLEPNNDKYISELIKYADKNGDGAIDYKELLELMGYNK
jgi:calcium-dependent protein kinase